MSQGLKLANKMAMKALGNVRGKIEKSLRKQVTELFSRADIDEILNAMCAFDSLSIGNFESRFTRIEKEITSSVRMHNNELVSAVKQIFKSAFSNSGDAKLAALATASDFASITVSLNKINSIASNIYENIERKLLSYSGDRNKSEGDFEIDYAIDQKIQITKATHARDKQLISSLQDAGIVSDNMLSVTDNIRNIKYFEGGIGAITGQGPTEIKSYYYKLITLIILIK